MPTRKNWKEHKQYRLRGYDYSSNGAYFITVVTKKRKFFFGEIIDQKMILNEIGEFVDENFETIKKKINHLTVENYVIMPNHLHLIIHISNEDKKENQYPKGIQPLIKKSISSFINQLKGTVTKWCDKNNHEYFQWQSKFHDRIIRNEIEYENFYNYINNNVANWKGDIEHQ